MPYIKDKEALSSAINYVNPQNAGELNYCITKLIHNYLQTFKESYSKYNEVIGVLSCVGRELYRIVISKYENKKRRENGVISDLDSRTLEEVR